MTEPNLSVKALRQTHSSGLRILLVKKDVSTTWAAIRVGIGSSDRSFLSGPIPCELPSGVAHYLEHKLFDQPGGSDVTEVFAGLSADVNAYTTETETVYLFSCTDDPVKPLETLLNFVTTPWFTAKSVAKERPIIAEEIRMYKDSPDSRLFQLLVRGMYENHPIRDDIAGKISDLRRITPELLYRVHSAFYNLHNMALCVCGNIEVEQILAVCDRLLRPAEPPDFVRAAIDEPPGVRRKRVSGKANVTKPKCAVGIKDDPLEPGIAGMRRTVTDRLLCELLFGRSSDFATSLYEEGVTLSPLFVDLIQNECFSLLQLSADCPDPDLFFEKVSEYIEKIRSQGIRRADLLRCRKALCGSLIMACDDPEAICELLIDHAFDDFGPADELRLMLTLERSELEAELKRFFRDDRMTFCSLLPLSDREKNDNTEQERTEK